MIRCPRSDSVSARFVGVLLAQAAARGAATRVLDLRGQRLADLAEPRDSEASGFMARMHLD